MSLRHSLSASIISLLLAVVSWSSTASGATMRIVVRDGAASGFNDQGAPDAASTAGGNNGATIGAQRLNALQHAANIWGALLESPVEITIDAQFAVLACTCRDSNGNVVACNTPGVATFSATAGTAAPISVALGFANAPRDVTVYAAALANSLAGADLNAQSDINATFSSVFNTAACAGRFYYGLNGILPAGSVDFVTIALHEIGHGLGIITFMDLANGQRLQGTNGGQTIDLNDQYLVNLEDHSTGKLYPEMTNAERAAASKDTGDLHWIGPALSAYSPSLTGGVSPPNHVQIYAPPSLQLGASATHLSDAVSPDELMEPVLALTTVRHNPGAGLNLLRDAGWRLIPNVTNTNDGGAGSLRNAIAAAPNPGVVTFAPGLAGKGINLFSPIEVAGKTLLIDASRAPGVYLDGGGTVRPLVTTSANVTVDGLGFLDGVASAGPGITGEGGAINNQGTMVLRNCTFGRNQALRGGAIFNRSSSLTIENCTFASNTAEEGGALYDSGGALTLRNSTLSRNTGTSLTGGGLFLNGATSLVENCTITANAATRSGGGIDAIGGSLVIRNTILAGNTAAVSAPDCRTSGLTVALKGHNFVGSTNGFTFTQESTDIIGVAVAAILKTNANGPLMEDNGGSTMTIQLLPAGSAVDGGSGPTALRNDQRSASRVLDGNRDAVPIVDIGAYELGFPAKMASASVGAGGTVRTNPTPGATPADPVETAVMTPGAGVVSILQMDSSLADQNGYELYGQRVLISAPDATVGNPLNITFWVDQTRVPRNQAGQLILDVVKDGVQLNFCPVAGQASPNPCISTAFGAGDDLVMVIVSTREQSRPSPPCPCAPIVTCPADIVRSTSNAGGIAVTFQSSAEDGCGRALPVNCTPPSGSTFPQGTTRVICEATGSGGAVTSCEFNVTVNCTDPTITCPANMAVETTSPAGAVVNFTVTARNGCSGALPVTSVPASGSTFPLGTTRVDCEATDPQGRKAACSFNVTVTCQGNPAITCPQDLTVDATSPDGAVVDFQATAKDGCGRNLTVNSTPASGTVFPVGRTTVFCSATDAAGRRSTCDFDVTVGCPGPPVVICPEDLTVGCTGPQGAVVSFESTATDGCLRNLAVTCNPPSGSVFPPGMTTVTCRATDGAGRSSECSFAVNVPCFPQGGLQRPGDCNQDGTIDISDSLCLLGFLFLGSPTELPCNGGAGFTLADWNGLEGVDLSDAVALLTFTFLGGPPHVLGKDCTRIDLCPSVCGP